MMDSSYPWLWSLNVANFVTAKPCLVGDEKSSSFKIWRKQMLCLLESQDVVGFVDGSVIPPADAHQQKLWRRTDSLIQGWILGSIGNDALHAVWEKQTARDIWLELDNIFNDQQGKENGDYSRYLPLYQAAQRGNWETAKNFFPDKNELGTTIISSSAETPLHVAVLTGITNYDFVKKLVELVPSNELKRTNCFGDTALHKAAMVGNTKAAMLMVDKNPDLVYIRNDYNQLPVMTAAINCQKDTLRFLISKYEVNAEHTLYETPQGCTLLNEIIASEFVEVALDLAQRHPNLAILTDEHGNSALSTIAETDTLFPRLETFTWWAKIIYHRIPLKKPKCEASRTTSVAGDIENSSKDGAAQNYSMISGVWQKMESMIWNVIIYLVPTVKYLRNKKATHQAALQFAEYLCHKLVYLPENEASIIFRRAIEMAAKYGRSEIVEMIIHYYPEVTFHRGSDGRNVFLLAASYRFENIINLIYNMSDRKYMVYDCVDDQGNNLMHICGKLAPPNRLNLVAGAALQMQRELQWFMVTYIPSISNSTNICMISINLFKEFVQEMQKFVHPSRRTWLNTEKQTPKMIFTKEHENLKAEGERWMKDTANACTIAAALIATVMFAAAFTVPGGLESATGVPLFSTQPAFDLFAVSDAISLFTSIYSLLMFLSILTSRYAWGDFLYGLPKRLSIGLLSLFVSITFMMVAFCATFYLVFHRDGAWYQLLLAAFACLPATSFVLLQFPLLVDVVWSTYGPGIFGKKSGRLLY